MGPPHEPMLNQHPFEWKTGLVFLLPWGEHLGRLTRAK